MMESKITPSPAAGKPASGKPTLEQWRMLQADLVLTSFKATGFLGEKFGTTEMIAVAHKLHPLSQKPLPLDERDLKSYRQIVVRNSGIYRRLDVGWLGA